MKGKNLDLMPGLKLTVNLKGTTEHINRFKTWFQVILKSFHFSGHSFVEELRLRS